MITIGSKFETWFSGEADGMSTVVDILPYTGKYTEYFNCVLVLTAPGTKKGCLPMSAQCIIDPEITEQW